MAKGRTHRLALVEPPEMSKGRLFRAALAGAPPTVVASRGRVHRAALGGVAAVALQPMLDRTVEPLTIVNLTAVLSGGGAADTYAWRRVSGPAVTFFGTGADRSFRAPGLLPPVAPIVIGVTATVDGVTSPERTVTITVLPQISWERRHNADWMPARIII